MATVKPLVVDAITGNPREAKAPDTIDPAVLPSTGGGGGILDGGAASTSYAGAAKIDCGRAT